MWALIFRSPLPEKMKAFLSCVDYFFSCRASRWPRSHLQWDTSDLSDGQRWRGRVYASRGVCDRSMSAYITFPHFCSCLTDPRAAAHCMPGLSHRGNKWAIQERRAERNNLWPNVRKSCSPRRHGNQLGKDNNSGCRPEKKDDGFILLALRLVWGCHPCFLFLFLTKWLKWEVILLAVFSPSEKVIHSELCEWAWHEWMFK